MVVTVLVEIGQLNDCFHQRAVAIELTQNSSGQINLASSVLFSEIRTNVELIISESKRIKRVTFF